MTNRRSASFSSLGLWFPSEEMGPWATGRQYRLRWSFSYETPRLNAKAVLPPQPFQGPRHLPLSPPGTRSLVHGRDYKIQRVAFIFPRSRFLITKEFHAMATVINGLPSLISKSAWMKRLFFILTWPLTKWITVGQWVRRSGFPLMHLLSENNIACLVCFTRLMWSHRFSTMAA